MSAIGLALIGFGVWLYVRIPHVGDLFHRIYPCSTQKQGEGAAFFLFPAPILAMIAGPLMLWQFRKSGGRRVLLNWAIAGSVYLVAVIVALTRFHDVSVYYHA